MGQKLTERDELAETPASGDFFHVVDVSDTTDSADGTSKRVQAQYLTIPDSTDSVKGKSVLVAGQVHAATEKTTPVDADEIGLIDSAASYILKRLTFLNVKLAVMSALNPIGTIREFNVATNPGTLLGFGTWVAHGTGRSTIAIDAGDATMDTVDETGGAKTVTIGQTNLPNISTGAGTAHTHVQNAHTHTRAGQTTGGSGGIRYDAATGTTITMDNATATNQNESAHTHSLGGSGTALNVMNPFIVVYRWVRTA